MGTRVVHTSESMPGKFSLKNHVKKLTKECLKAFESCPEQKPSAEIKDSISADQAKTRSDELTDGTDSGVEVARALSSSGSDRYTPGQSCGSSLMSCYSETEGDRVSDCGSENSGRPINGKRFNGSLSESCSENSSTSESQNLSQSNRVQPPKTEQTRMTVRRSESVREKSLVRSEKTRSRTPRPSGKMDDGRWPSTVQKSIDPRSRVSHEPIRLKLSAPVSTTVIPSVMTSSFGGSKTPVGEVKSNALDKYGTLPRRPKRKSLEHGEPVPAAKSGSREPSLNRAATLRRQQSREKEQVTNGKSLPPYPKTRKSTGRTVIYHEISIQTSVTGEDITNVLAGVSPPDPFVSPAVEKANKAVQSEGRENLKKMEENYNRQCEELEKERLENERLKTERKETLSRICRLLGYESEREDSVNELEHHFQAVGLTVIKQQEELSELRHFKSIMQRDLEKSFAAQKNLLQQQQDIEAEYLELHDFLQAEKTALAESLNDTEAELERLRREFGRKEEELQQQQEECKHLVRICEQRRQENLSLEAKLSGLEQRSRDVIVQQGAAVSGAAVALSGLGARLDSLVEHLATSCNIPEKDLEDVVYHNEAYGQSEDNSPDGPPPKIIDSPKKGTSFLNAIMGALRSATQSPFATPKNSNSQTGTSRSEEWTTTRDDHSSDSLGLLENCLESASSVSHYTDCGSCSSVGELKYQISNDTITLVANAGYETSQDLSRSDSIQNLSAAILARQEIEKIERTLSPDLIIPTEVNSLVDKVIDVDNLLTKLLKVLRIIQMENDVSIEQLEDQKSELSEQLQQEQLSRLKTENHLQTLQYELKEARSQLSARIIQLEQAKMMLGQDHRIHENQRQFAAIHNAIGTLQSIQDVVDRCPPLAKLQQDLEGWTSNDDFNANAATDNVSKTVVKRNAQALTTAV